MVKLTYTFWKDDVHPKHIGEMLAGATYDYSYTAELTDFGQPGFYDLDVYANYGPLRVRLPLLSHERITASEVFELTLKHTYHGAELEWLRTLFGGSGA